MRIGMNGWPSNWNLGDARKLKSAGLDTIRVQFLPESEWYENQIQAFHDVVLPDCHAQGLGVILNIWFREAEYFTNYRAVWGDLIDLYDHRDCVVAYDLVNEPKSAEYLNWASEIAKSVRALTNKPLIIQPGHGPDCNGFADLKPINDDNIIYSFHSYEPYPFTFQGLEGRDTGVSWPGESYGAHRDIKWLFRRYKEAIRFQWRYGAKILLGEMGCSLHCPDEDAERYFRDNLTLCRRLGWDLMIHGWGTPDFPDRLDMAKRLLAKPQGVAAGTQQEQQSQQSVA